MKFQKIKWNGKKTNVDVQDKNHAYRINCLNPMINDYFHPIKMKLCFTTTKSEFILESICCQILINIFKYLSYSYSLYIRLLDNQKPNIETKLKVENWCLIEIPTKKWKAKRSSVGV